MCFKCLVQTTSFSLFLFQNNNISQSLSNQPQFYIFVTIFHFHFFISCFFDNLSNNAKLASKSSMKKRFNNFQKFTNPLSDLRIFLESMQFEQPLTYSFPIWFDNCKIEKCIRWYLFGGFSMIDQGKQSIWSLLAGVGFV